MITSVTVQVGLQARIVKLILMTVREALVQIEAFVLTGFKIIPVFVKLDLLEMTAKLPSMNVNPHRAYMEHVQTYIMTTDVHVRQDILEEIVLC